MRILLACVILLLSGCGQDALYQSHSYVFGTLVDISIYNEPEKRSRELASHVEQEFQRLHNQLHAWQESSELYHLNQTFREGKTPIPISGELAYIIKNASDLSVQSKGSFNPAIGGLIHAWGFQRDNFTPIDVSAMTIAEWVSKKPQMSDIILNGNSAFSKNPAVQVDLGGYAKGYALDKAREYLLSQKVHSALINIGGNIIAIGKHGDAPWRIGIQHPRKPTPIATIDLPDGWAIGTSGDYQRYFEKDGKRYCHIINPFTGYPAQGTESVTILVPPGKNAGTVSDAASKPIFIAETNTERVKAAAEMGIMDFMVIDSQGKIFISPSIKDKLHWEESNVEYQILR